MESGGGGEQNYWPGFVDALANVVLTLIFVLVIFVFALAMASNKVEERMRQVEAAENAQKTQANPVPPIDPKVVEDLQRQLQQAQAELAGLKGSGKSEVEDSGALSIRETSNIAQNAEVVVHNVTDPNRFEGAVNIQNREGMLKIGFPEAVSQMDEKSQSDLTGLINGLHGTQASKIAIRSVMGNETFSAAQRSAYYRAVNVRNFLITKLAIDPGRITSEIVKPDSTGLGRVEIVFRK